MTLHQTRVLALVVVLIGFGALVPSTRVDAQQTIEELRLDELRARAEQGDAEAQNRLGLIYGIGVGVPEDGAEAVRWYRLAADQGFSPAQVGLGEMYNSGQGVPQDYVMAAFWFLLAAEQGNPGGQASLGSLYYSGNGVTQDYVEAHMWYNLAASGRDGSLHDFHAESRDAVAGK